MCSASPAVYHQPLQTHRGHSSPAQKLHSLWSSGQPIAPLPLQKAVPGPRMHRELLRIYKGVEKKIRCNQKSPWEPRSALYFARSSEKWKHGVPCSKIISNFKMATAEHESKPRTLRIAGPCVTAQVGQSQTSSEVIISKPFILWVRTLKTRSGKHSLVPVPCDFMQ